MNRREILLAAGAAALTTGAPAEAASPYKPLYAGGVVVGRRYQLPTPLADEIDVLGNPPPTPRKTALLLYQQGRNSLTVAGLPSADMALLLVADGWTVCSVTTPSHGYPDLFPGEPTQINGWAWRYANGHRLWDLGFFQRITLGLDILVNEGYTDPNKIAAVGFSRGGLCAFHAAVNDPRLRVIAAVNPATELLQMNPWFVDHPNPEACAQEDVSLLAPQLVNHSIYWTVCAVDTVVSREAVERSYNACRLAALPPPESELFGLWEPDHRLSIVPAPWHKTPVNEYPLIITWMNSRIATA